VSVQGGVETVQERQPGRLTPAALPGTATSDRPEPQCRRRSRGRPTSPCRGSRREPSRPGVFRAPHAPGLKEKSVPSAFRASSAWPRRGPSSGAGGSLQACKLGHERRLQNLQVLRQRRVSFQGRSREAFFSLTCASHGCYADHRTHERRLREKNVARWQERGSNMTDSFLKVTTSLLAFVLMWSVVLLVRPPAARPPSRAS